MAKRKRKRRQSHPAVVHVKRHLHTYFSVTVGGLVAETIVHLGWRTAEAIARATSAS